MIGRNHLLVKSWSLPGYHAVDLEPLDEAPFGGCSCQGFFFNETCRHWRMFQ